MADTSLHVVARITGLPDKVQELEAVVSGLIEPTRAEPGCIQYDLIRNVESPQEFVFIEQWEGEAQLEEHLASAHIQAALAQLPSLLAEDPDIRRYHLIGLASDGMKRS